MIYVFALIGLLTLMAGFSVAFALAWSAFQQRKFSCLFGVHRWSSWWVSAWHGDRCFENAEAIQRKCLKCGEHQTAAAGWPWDKNRYMKEEFYTPDELREAAKRIEAGYEVPE